MDNEYDARKVVSLEQFRNAVRFQGPAKPPKRLEARGSYRKMSAQLYELFSLSLSKRVTLSTHQTLYKIVISIVLEKKLDRL